MAYFEAEGKCRNFPALASRNFLPNLWLKYDRTDRTPLKRDECNLAFNKLMHELKQCHAIAPDRVQFTDLASFDPELHMSVVEELLQTHLWPKVGKELRDPVGHTAFASNDLRDAWLACGRLDFGSTLPKPLVDDLDKVFRVDNYGNVISLFARPNSPVASAYDHFFPFSRGGRTRSVPGSTETNIIMIQWKANSIKSDTIEQLLQPSELCTGMTPEQVVVALKSSNGFYGVPAVPFLLGFDPLLDCSSVPDRSDVFSNWKVPTVEGGKCFRDQITDALTRIRESEVKREQAYIDRKQKRADRKENSQTKVNPYTFQVAPTAAPAAVDMRLLEYGVFLRATLVDGTLDPTEIDALAHLREKHKITDAEHTSVLENNGLALAYADALAKATAPVVQDTRARVLESMAKAAAITVDGEVPLDRAALAGARQACGADEETNKVLKEQYDAVQGQLQIERLPSFSVAELRGKCRALELPVSGKKEELIARITERLMADDKKVVTTQSTANSLEDSLRLLSDAELLERAAAEKITVPAEAKTTKLALYRHITDALTTIASLATLTKPQLVALARARSLAVSGTKEQLVERIRNAIASGTSTSAKAAPVAVVSGGDDETEDIDRTQQADVAATRRTELTKLDHAQLVAECGKLGVPTAGANDDSELRRRLQVAGELDAMNMAELRAKCIAASLKVSGNKAAVRERLLSAMAPAVAESPKKGKTKEQLVDECRTLSLGVSGTKEQLTENLRKHWSEQTKPVLAEKCKQLGAKVSGTKEELVQRILDATT